MFKPAPPAATALGRYRILSPNAGVRVSPIQLGAFFSHNRDGYILNEQSCSGAMSIGDQWDKIGMGAMDRESSFKLLDAYFDAGGNFVDTSSN